MWYKRAVRTVCLPLLYAAASVNAATLIVPPSADTTLIETAPTNNMGAQLFVNAGANNLRPPERVRGLFKFDLSSIPPGSQITSVQVSFWVVRAPSNENMASPFALRRVLKDWGEGNKTNSAPGSPGLGQPATEGEATWLARFTKTTNTWTTPGGALSSDFSDIISDDQFIYGTDQSPYLFGPTDALISDVQTWVNSPQFNFGWVLMTESEDVGGTARRFGSREDPNNTPTLEVDYNPPAGLRLDVRENSPGQIVLGFNAQAAQSYAIEFAVSLPPMTWQTLTNISATGTNRSISIPLFAGSISGGKFFRLRSP